MVSRRDPWSSGGRRSLQRHVSPSIAWKGTSCRVCHAAPGSQKTSATCPSARVEWGVLDIGIGIHTVHSSLLLLLVHLLLRGGVGWCCDRPPWSTLQGVRRQKLASIGSTDFISKCSSFDNEGATELATQIKGWPSAISLIQMPCTVVSQPRLCLCSLPLCKNYS